MALFSAKLIYRSVPVQPIRIRMIIYPYLPINSLQLLIDIFIRLYREYKICLFKFGFFWGSLWRLFVVRFALSHIFLHHKYSFFAVITFLSMSGWTSFIEYIQNVYTSVSDEPDDAAASKQVNVPNPETRRLYFPNDSYLQCWYCFVAHNMAHRKAFRMHNFMNKLAWAKPFTLVYHMNTIRLHINFEAYLILWCNKQVNKLVSILASPILGKAPGRLQVQSSKRWERVVQPLRLELWTSGTRGRHINHCAINSDITVITDMSCSSSSQPSIGCRAENITEFGEG